jgi:hypothetical protein
VVLVAIVPIIHALISGVCPIDGVSGPVATQAGPGYYPSADGSFWRLDFGPSASAQQRTSAISTLAAYNVASAQNIVNGEVAFESALASGITLTWSTSTALNDTYPIDTATQVRMLAERVNVSANGTFTNGTTTLTWYGLSGTQHTMSLSQANLFVQAVWKYLTALFVQRAVSASGASPSWPSPNVSITG